MSDILTIILLNEYLNDKNSFIDTLFMFFSKNSYFFGCFFFLMFIHVYQLFNCHE